jgi:hypothetical protein
MNIFKRLSQRLFCRPRTLAEVRDQQPGWSGIMLITDKDGDGQPMKTLIIIALFAALCAVAAGSLTQTAFHTLIDSSCDDALAEYRVEHMETLRELKRLEKFVGGWGLPKP